MELKEKFERKKQILIKNRESAIARLEKSKEKFEKIKNDETIDKKELRLEIALRDIKSKEWALQLIDEKLEFIRPSSKEDMEYRLRQYYDFYKHIKRTIPEDLHLCFHGCPVFAAKHIIEDGGISSSVDRIGRTTSYDVEDQISVTTKNTIEITVRDYADLNGNFELPAGCIFAILPKNEKEIKSSESSMIIGNVSFKDNTERLYAIITTPENIERVSEWAKNANIDLSKIHDYDGFIKVMEKSNGKSLFSEQGIGKATINTKTEEKDKVRKQIEQQIKTNDNLIK